MAEYSESLENQGGHASCLASKADATHGPGELLIGQEEFAQFHLLPHNLCALCAKRYASSGLTLTHEHWGVDFSTVVRFTE